jgi:endonuclease/exonuclease/phosphatase family metal-dependent hydrolase
MVSLVATVTRAEAHKEALSPAKEGGVSMRRIAILLAAIVAGVLVATGVGIAASSSDSQQQTSSVEKDTKVTVMTRNVYHGVDAEFAQAIAAPDFRTFLTATAAVYNGYHQRNFPERADALAAEIEATHPDVVGLQEAIKVRTDRPPNGTTPPNAEQVSLEYLQILLDKLQARELHYDPVVQRDNFDIEAPADENSDGIPDFELRHTDRIAMLIRTDGKSDLKVLGTNSGQFQMDSNCKLNTRLLGPIEIVRGWTSVDLSIQGKAVRFINTHLDGDCSDPKFQRAQAQEILDGPVQDARNKNLPVVLLGDLNSKADGSGTPTYADLLKVGFADAWAQAGSGSGFTCCQDDDLLNKASHLSDRRDFVLFGNGSFQTTEVQVVGASPADRTPSGLWPSDHAGVVAKLRLLF